MASQKGHCDVVQLLLLAKANANQASTDGVSPLHVASIDGNSDVVQLLISAKANVNQKSSKNGRGPLFNASRDGHCDVVRILLSAGARVKDSGSSSLHAASLMGHWDVVQLLLLSSDAIAINAVSSFGNSPLMTRHIPAMHQSCVCCWRTTLTQTFAIRSATRPPPCTTQRWQGTSPLPICSHHLQSWTMGSLRSSVVNGWMVS